MKKFLYLCVFLLPSWLYSQNQMADERAAAIADSVILVMGGSHNWDKVHFLSWNFFGRRLLYWDKWTGDVRIEIPSKQLILITNLNNGKGHAYRNKEELLQPDSINYFMDRAFKIWANDSYWLIMPFKLKDPGVHLKFLGQGADSAGIPCLKLEVTFDKVGVTPENKYHVYINRETYLVTQWDYFEKHTDPIPAISTPWSNYIWFGNILLSDERGTKQGKLTDIAVYDRLPAGLFEKP